LIRKDSDPCADVSGYFSGGGPKEDSDALVDRAPAVLVLGFSLFGRSGGGAGEGKTMSSWHSRSSIFGVGGRGACPTPT
jgi:hypothetical protein